MARKRGTHKRTVPLLENDHAVATMRANPTDHGGRRRGNVIRKKVRSPKGKFR